MHERAFPAVGFERLAESRCVRRHGRRHPFRKRISRDRQPPPRMQKVAAKMRGTGERNEHGAHFENNRSTGDLYLDRIIRDTASCRKAVCWSSGFSLRRLAFVLGFFLQGWIILRISMGTNSAPDANRPRLKPELVQQSTTVRSLRRAARVPLPRRIPPGQPRRCRFAIVRSAATAGRG